MKLVEFLCQLKRSQCFRIPLTRTQRYIRHQLNWHVFVFFLQLLQLMSSVSITVAFKGHKVSPCAISQTVVLKC